MVTDAIAFAHPERHRSGFRSNALSCRSSNRSGREPLWRTPIVSELSSLVDSVIVLDAASRYVFLGTLASLRPVDAVAPKYAVLVDADAHDLRDTHTTRDSYILDAKQHGVSVNRREVWVRLDEIVSIARLDDIVA